MEKINAIRCPNDRPHNKYNLCGRLLGVVIDNKICLYCEDCGQFFQLVIKENNNVEMTPLPKNIKFKFKTAIRAIIK